MATSTSNQTASFSSDDEDGSSVDSTRIKEMFDSMDRLDEMLAPKLSPEEIDQLKALDQKHAAYYFRRMKKVKGPPPTPQEILEYRQSLSVRIRAMSPARQRLFLAEHSDDDQFDQYWGYLEKACSDINTYQYAYIGIIMKELEHMDLALQVLRILLVYANALLNAQCSAQLLTIT